jgi:hypothetical protein
MHPTKSYVLAFACPSTAKTHSLKIIKIMKIEFGNHTLSKGKAFREAPIDLTVISGRLIQEAHFIGAPVAQQIDRGNMHHSLRFQVVRKHASADAALKHALLHASMLQGLEATFKATSEDEGASISLSSAVMKRIESTVKGAISLDRYEIVGGLFENTVKGALS